MGLQSLIIYISIKKKRSSTKIENLHEIFFFFQIKRTVQIKDYSISPVITYNVEITSFRRCRINTKPVDVVLTLFDVGVTWRILTK